MTRCLHCGDEKGTFDIAHVCSSGVYAPILKPLPDAKQCDWDAISTHLLDQAKDAARWRFLTQQMDESEVDYLCCFDTSDWAGRVDAAMQQEQKT